MPDQYEPEATYSLFFHDHLPNVWATPTTEGKAHVSIECGRIRVGVYGTLPVLREVADRFSEEVSKLGCQTCRGDGDVPTEDGERVCPDCKGAHLRPTEAF